MTDLRQAAQRALKEMDDHMYRADTHEFYEAKEALRAALAEPQTTHWEGCEAVHPECRKPEQKPSGSFVLWENTLCNPLADLRSMAHSAWHDGYASGVKAEREECAKILDGAPRLVPSLQFPGGHCFVCGLNSEKIAEAIRSRT